MLEACHTIKVQQWRLRCDRCGTKTDPAPTIDAALDAAWELGWWLRGNGTHVCPTCVEFEACPTVRDGG